MSPDEELTRRWAQAFNDRDLDTMLEMAAADIDMLPMQFAVSGRYSGHEGLRRWRADLDSWDPGHRVELGHARDFGDGRVVLFGTVILDGEPLSPYALMVRIENGKIAAMRSYLNDEETLERMGVFN
jgi:ketosteroid isomerase-like protein